jgi:F-type H+-transporting ATPase subunit epsilon
MTQELFDEMLSEAKAAYVSAQEVFKNEPGPVDDAAKLLSDMVAIGGHIGLTANN